MVRIAEVAASFTRPADTTAYADNDLVANSTTAGSVTPMTFVLPRTGSQSYRVVAVRLSKSGATATNANFSLWLFQTEPTVANGDNGAFSPILAGAFTGPIACDMTASPYSDDASVTKVIADPIPFQGDWTVYGLLTAEAAYTPASAEIFTATVVVEYW